MNILKNLTDRDLFAKALFEGIKNIAFSCVFAVIVFAASYLSWLLGVVLLLGFTAITLYRANVYKFVAVLSSLASQIAKVYSSFRGASITLSRELYLLGEKLVRLIEVIVGLSLIYWLSKVYFA